MRQPTAIIHLDVTPEEALRRIRLRNLERENGIDIGYMRDLHAAYEKWLPEIAKSIRVIRIDWSSYDAKTDDVVDAIVKCIENNNLMSTIAINSDIVNSDTVPK
jgi:deoxyadenosine kinase